MLKFRFLPHTADIKFRAYGKTLEEAFANSCLAVSSVLSNGNKINSKKEKKVKVEGGDNKSILRNLLEEIVYLFDAENFITVKAKVEFDETARKLRAVFFGDSSENYSNLDHIKSVTYSEMFVKKVKDKWVTQVVLDV